MMLASLLLAACTAVPPAADQIRARDLGPAFSADANLPDTPVALAPVPGVHRYFGIAELSRLAFRLGIGATPVKEICFDRPLIPLDPEKLLEGMRRVLPGAAIEILDYSRAGAPEGDLEFTRGGLRKSPAGSFWNGQVHYAGSRRYMIWAKVRLSVSVDAVVAAEDLPAGRVLSADAVRVQHMEDLPAAVPLPAAVEEVAGRQLRRSVRAGAAIRKEWLEPPSEVRRGDSVRVQVRSGGARLELDGRAAGSGTAGETILVVNPETRRSFRARVEAPGKVTVEKESR